MSQTETPTGTSISLSIPRLPDFGTVGGNQRIANPGQRIRIYEAEKKAWAEMLRAVGAPQFDEGAYFNGPVQLLATLHFPTLALPDYENAIYALKTLVDLFEPFRGGTKIARVSRKPYKWTKGMLGWMANDKQIVWPWIVTAITQSPLAPRTDIEIRAIGHEQRALL